MYLGSQYPLVQKVPPLEARRLEVQDEVSVPLFIVTPCSPVRHASRATDRTGNSCGMSAEL